MLDKQEQLLELLKERLVSEKSQRLEALNVLVFKVKKEASKASVAQAVELLLESKVKTVNLLKVKGKLKHVRGRRINRPDWKKAYVTLWPNQALEPNQTVPAPLEASAENGRS